MWAGSDGGISLSNNRGDSWESILNIPLAQYYAIHADNRLPFYNITGGLQDNGTWTGPSRTRTGGIAPSDWKMVTGGDGFFATVHPDNPNVFLTESQGGRLSMTNIETGEQQAVAPQPQAGRVADLKYRFNWNTPIVTSPHGGQTVFFGGSALFQTRNFGRAWEPISPDLTRNIRERMKSAGGADLVRQFDGGESRDDCFDWGIAGEGGRGLGGDRRRECAGDAGQREDVEQRGGEFAEGGE
jgi:hypothetical protein